MRIKFYTVLALMVLPVMVLASSFPDSLLSVSHVSRHLVSESVAPDSCDVARLEKKSF